MASLIATSDKGCLDSTTVNYQSFEKVVPAFTVNNVCLDETSNFQDQSTSYLPFSEYRWTFGDGNFGTGKNASHVYASSGTFNCTHTVVTIPGCEYSTQDQTTIHPKLRRRIEVG